MYTPTANASDGTAAHSSTIVIITPSSTSAAKFACVCSYDRAGDGWSELGPHPRTFRQIV
jgi:hypothetical protein